MHARFVLLCCFLVNGLVRSCLGSGLTEDSRFSLAAASLSSWTVLGSAKISENNVVSLTNSDENGKQEFKRYGVIWNKTPFTYAEWEISIEFTVSGTSTIGGEGLMLLISNDPIPSTTGPIFGFKDNFNGLAIIFDSKDDDHMRNNPAVSAHLMNGESRYILEDDGVSQQLAGCIADFRNRKHPVTAKVRYSAEQELSVLLDLHGRGSFQRCISYSGIDFSYKDPRFIGIGAMSYGENMDAHDILSFTVNKLNEKSDDYTEKETEINVDTNEEEFVDLTAIDPVLHAKLDQLMHSSMGSVDSKQLGLALEEIEKNILKQMNGEVVPMLNQLRNIYNRLEDFESSLGVLKSHDLPKIELQVQDIKRIVERNTPHTDFSQILKVELKKAIASEMETLQRNILQGMQKSMLYNDSRPSSSSGIVFWLLILFSQAVFAGFVVLKQIQSRRMKLL